MAVRVNSLPLTSQFNPNDLFILDQSSTTRVGTLSNLVPQINQTPAEALAGVTPTNPLAFVENDIRRYGALGQGEDNTAHINTVLSVASQNGRPVNLSNLNLNSSGGHVHDLSKYSVQNGTIFFPTMLDSQTAWTATATVNGVTQNWRHAQNILSNVSLIGSGVGIGLLIQSPSEPAAAFLNFAFGGVSNFRVGGQVGNNAYILKFFGFYFRGCPTNFLVPSGISNAAEEIFFTAGGFTDSSGIALDNQNGNTDVVCNGCSFDGNNVVLVHQTGGSRTFLRDCHLELLQIASQSVSPIQVEGNNCTLLVDGGSITGDGNVPSPMPSVFDIASGAQVILDGGLLLNNLRNSANVLCSGSGSMRIRPGTITYQSANNPLLVGASSNFGLLADPNFTQASIVDNIALTSDTAAITSRTAGTNISIAIGNGGSPSQQCLAATKVGGVGTTASYCVFVPSQPGQRFGVRGQYAASSALTNNIFLYGGFCRLIYSANGVPILLNSGLVSGANISSLSQAFTQFEIGQFVAPNWADTFFLSANLNGLAGGASFYLYNLFITAM